MYRTPEGKDIFVVDGHTHFWDGSPENQKQHPRQAVHRVLLCLPHGAEPEGAAVGEEQVREIQRRRSLSRPVHRRSRRRGDRPVDLSQGFLQERLQHDRAQRRGRQALSGALHRQRRLRSARRREGARIHPLHEGDLRHQGREDVHGRMERRLQGLEAQRSRCLQMLRALRQARHQEHPRPQGPDDHPAQQGCVRRP